MKKTIIIGVACLAFGTGLAGCGAGSSATVTTTAEATTAAETTAAAETTTAVTEATTTTTEAPATTTTESPTTTAKAHPEDERIMENLRNFYKSHDILDGVPAEFDYGTAKYSKFAIADFDADGENEVAIEVNYNKVPEPDHIAIYDSKSSDYSHEKSIFLISVGVFNSVTFLDNGIAVRESSGEVDYLDKKLDKKCYYIISKGMLEKLNYNLNNFYEDAKEFILTYSNLDGTIMKSMSSFQDQYFDPVEKTQEQYEADKAILNSGSVMDVQVKDFTAENVGLSSADFPDTYMGYSDEELCKLAYFYFYNQAKGTVKELGAEAEIESVDGKMVTIRIFGNNGQTHTKYEVDRVTGIGKDIDKDFNIDLWEYEGWLRQ